jgi:hypothetical protein
MRKGGIAGLGCMVAGSNDSATRPAHMIVRLRMPATLHADRAGRQRVYLA